MNPYTREKLENWVGDFCGSDAAGRVSSATREVAGDLLTRFLIAACEARDVEPDELEEPDAKAALLSLSRLDLPASVRRDIPDVCAEFLTFLEDEGRLGGGRGLAAYVRALRPAFEESASGKSKPIVNPGSKLGRNDPCPCGSGKKYKKCCMGE